MRLVIDCFKLIKGVGKSIGIYNVALSLTQSLVKEKYRAQNVEIEDVEIIVLGNEYNEVDFNFEGVNFVKIDFYDPTNKIHCILWELLGVARVCKKMNADKVLFPRGYNTLTHSINDIVLIHDLIPFYYDKQFPGVFNKLENAYIMQRLKASAKSAKQIVTISEASKRDILKYCSVEEKKITVIHNVCNTISFSEEKKMFCDSYICAITSGLPHKNAKGVLESYANYFERVENPLKLVVVGISDTSICNLSEKVKENIICYRYVKDNNEMYRIIANSTIFMFLSLIEGFGLPPIEAMQLKVPVVCSNTSSLPEVVGDAAILVNPTDKNEVANALIKLLDDVELRNKLISKGIKNIERFSWETRAKMYWNVILDK